MFKLPSLRAAKVVAGSGGLNKIVSFVSVLEYAEMDAMVLCQESFSSDELVISAFCTIMDDEEAQCKAVRYLYSVGEAALVLYYLGIFVKELSPRLLAIADELDFPLIVMPPNQVNLRYREVLMDCMDLIFKERRRDAQFAADILENASRMKPQQRTIATVMRLLSDRMQRSLLLTSRIGAEIAFAAWPMSAEFEYELLQSVISSCCDQDDEYQLTVDMNGRLLYVSHVAITAQTQKQMHLFSLKDESVDDHLDMQQAANVIRSFGNIWHCDFYQKGPDALLRAVINNQQDEIRRLSNMLHIDMGQFSTVWLFADRYSNNDKSLGNAMFMQKIDQVLQEHFSLVLTDAINNYVVSFTNNPKFPKLKEDIPAQLQEEIEQAGGSAIIVHCGSLDTLAQLREAYSFCETYLHSARAIFPQKRVFTYNDMAFARSCMDIVRQRAEGSDWYLSLLRPLEERPDEGAALIETLTVFFLDTNSNMQKTADILYMHRNSIKYRVNRIRQLLDCDISASPLYCSLYTAVALRRLSLEMGKDPDAWEAY